MANYLLTEFIIRSIRNSTYKWTLSQSGSFEYYCELNGGGDPGLYEFRGIAIDGTEATAGTIGSLAAGEVGWGDHDALNFNTVYIRLADNTDPDTKGTDYIGYIEFLSSEGIALTHWWDDKIQKFDNISSQLSTEYGGFNRLSFGRIYFSQDLFTDDWPPPITGRIKIKYTETTEAASEIIFDGTVYLVEITRESIVYELWERPFTTDLLTEAVNIDGDTVPMPRAFGTVTHGNPVQLATLVTNYRYDLAWIQGTAHTDWHVFDDGVDVCSNVSNFTPSSNIFELDAAPVGEVTISGAGEDGTVEDIVDWACGSSYLNFTLASPNARATSPRVSYWASSQEKLIDFLSNMTAFNTHLFYVSASTLTLVDMLVNNSSRTLTEFDFFPTQYNYTLPTKKITSKWIVGEAGEWSNAATISGSGLDAAVYVKRTDKELIKESDFSFGNEIELMPYHYDISTIPTALNNILTILHKPKSNLRIPLQGDLPVPGEKISWSDTAMHIDTDMFIKARTIHYNFDNEEIVIEGEGTLTST